MMVNQLNRSALCRTLQDYISASYGVIFCALLGHCHLEDKAMFRFNDCRARLFGQKGRDGLPHRYGIRRNVLDYESAPFFKH
jgi:hypothetical protein